MTVFVHVYDFCSHTHTRANLGQVNDGAVAATREAVAAAWR